MLLVIAGMRRSASTLCYQLATEVVGDGSETRHVNHMPKDYRHQKTWYTVKTHGYHPDFLLDIKRGTTRVITTIRDPRDIAHSIMTIRNRPFGSVVNMVRSATEIQTAWEESIPGLLFIEQYEIFFDDLSVLIRDIAHAAGKDVGEIDVDQLVESYSFENNLERSQQINTTQADWLTPRHVQDGQIGKWRRLSREQVRQVEEAVGLDWMERHGYEPS